MKRRIGVWLTLVLFWLAIGSSLNLGYAAEAVPWQQIAAYLDNNDIALRDDLSLCDCPLVLAENNSGRQVVQVIANNVYAWREYELTGDGGKTQLALIMERPENKHLTAAEARILLTASTLWRNNSQRASEGSERGFPFPANATNPIRETAMRQGIIRTDDGSETLSKVPDVTLGPFKTIAILNYFQGDGYYRGNGVLISSRCLLTSGNNICYNLLSPPAWSTEMMIIPAAIPDYDTETLTRPYGTQLCNDLRVHPSFLADNNALSENDLGAAILNKDFIGLENGTFMPIEFNALPTKVMAAGYPFVVESISPRFEMWFDIGSILGTRGANNQIIDIDIYCGGFNGSPIFYFNKAAHEYRLIGIATWHTSTQDSGVRLTSSNQETILGWIDDSMGVDYTYTSYIPYMITGENNWSGVALTNHNTAASKFKLEFFMANGNPAGIEYMTLPANGQSAIVVKTHTAGEGWIKVSSSAPHHGLALIGGNTPSTMFDEDLKKTLNKQFIFSHLAADNQTWRSSLMACNPNAAAAAITYTYYDKNGVSCQAQATIPSQGSIKDDLYSRFGKALNGGHLIMQSSQPITAFLLYDSSFTGANNWKSGLSAEPLQH